MLSTTSIHPVGINCKNKLVRVRIFCKLYNFLCIFLNMTLSVKNLFLYKNVKIIQLIFKEDLLRKFLDSLLKFFNFLESFFLFYASVQSLYLTEISLDLGLYFFLHQTHFLQILCTSLSYLPTLSVQPQNGQMMSIRSPSLRGTLFLSTIFNLPFRVIYLTRILYNNI